MKTQQRIASSEIMNALFGNITLFQKALSAYVPSLIVHYGGETSLPKHFRAIPDRIICVCPMVLCRSLLTDLGMETPLDLIGPLGLAMYSISTHDDVVDEQPGERAEIAGLVYAGNIASLHGISLLVAKGYIGVAQKVIHLMNLNHRFQTDIVSSLWKAPSDEAKYLKAISHTGYWVAIGLLAGVEYAAEQDEGLLRHRVFAMKFGEFYGRMCQVYDDIREIDDDIHNGYFSLPISLALRNGYNLQSIDGRSQAIAKPKEIAEQSFRAISDLCGGKWPTLFCLAERMHEIGQRLSCA